MPTAVKTGLTGNQLKIIAMIAMTCDHVGLQLLPEFPILRILGRLSLPIYAYMIAEGCRYTRDRKKYLLRMAAMALLCQVVYYVAMGSLYQCILVTFSLSVCLICTADPVKKQGTGNTPLSAVFYGTLAGVWFLCSVMPDLLRNTDFSIDYGIWGVLLPVMVYFGSIRGLVIGLVLLALDCGGIQWFALAAVPLLMCYNGQRGRANIGKLFYWYYPVHLVVIYGLSLIL